MRARNIVFTVLWAAVALVGCIKEDGVSSVTSKSGDPLIERFEKVLAQRDYPAAYKMMCPEYTMNAPLPMFAQSLKASPYVKDVASFGGGTISTQGDVTQRQCVFIGPYGYIPATLYVRDLAQGPCVISLVVANFYSKLLDSVSVNVQRATSRYAENIVLT